MIEKSIPDGHCLLYSVICGMKSQINCPKIYDLNEIVRLMYHETMSNLDMYTDFLINGTSTDLIYYMCLYLYDKVYDTPYGDMVPLVLANDLGLNLIIISKSTMGYDIRQVCCGVLNGSNNCLLVYKSSDHYDGITTKSNANDGQKPVLYHVLSQSFQPCHINQTPEICVNPH